MKTYSLLSSIAVFLSAFLLFSLEPISARQLLPLFGGAAAVWTTCLVFFQCALLAGYLYAHLLTSRVRPVRQGRVHGALLIAAFAVLVTRTAAGTGPVTGSPVLTILWRLLHTVGLPFVLLAATSPLLQWWHSNRHAAGERAVPWSMFALSNAGSFLALIVYPTLIEPNWTLRTQWSFLYFGFGIFAAVCGFLAFLQGGRRRAFPAVIERSSNSKSEGRWQFQAGLYWLLLPCCASMLLCTFTNHLGQNIAAVPLLWILPLGAYLLSFVVSFGWPRASSLWITARMLALSLATCGYLVQASHTAVPAQISVPVYTVALFFACLFCHSELFRRRPEAASPTGFYLMVSCGSALGAILVGVAAPMLFHANHDLAISLVVLSLTATISTWSTGWPARLVWLAAAVGMAYAGVRQSETESADTIAQLRGFYGSLRVTETHYPPIAQTTRTLYHGTIQHGAQMFGGDLRTKPTNYYSPDSGIGLVLRQPADGPRTVGVVGLGTGTLAAYGRAGDRFVFYEIDPLVERLAKSLFTYLRDSPAEVHVVRGDARISISREPSSLMYDVLVLDAFSGDSVPLHLLTVQAFRLYLKHLSARGVLAVHISSQYLRLGPELALEAEHAGLQAVQIHSPANEDKGEFACDWVLMARDSASFRVPEISNASEPVAGQEGLRLWTDDYAAILPLLSWPSREPPRRIDRDVRK